MLPLNAHNLMQSLLGTLASLTSIQLHGIGITISSNQEASTLVSSFARYLDLVSAVLHRTFLDPWAVAIVWKGSSDSYHLRNLNAFPP
jgi:hypothetical protein